MSPFKRWISTSVNLIPWWLRYRIREIPGVAAFQRIILRHLLDGTEFVHTINAGPATGLKMRIRLPEDKLYWTGTWEHAVTETLVAHMQSGAICYDIGGHRGFMAGVMSQNGARAVYCFEPNPSNIARIRDLVELNPEARIELIPLAIGADNGTVDFLLMPEESMGKLSNSTFQIEARRSSQIEVEMRSLDSLVADQRIEPPALMKIDIEGAEAMALAGAESVISRHRPRVLIEVHSHDLLVQCRTWLEDREYDCSILEDDLGEIPRPTFRVCHLLGMPR